MRFLVFVVLVGCAVKCDDTNYYVIEIPEEPKLYKPFKVYWNVPTMQCRSKKIPFNNLHENFGIIQNANDSFRGEKIAILYDPGLFPALLKNETSGKFKFRNGGVPQEGDLEKHLTAFRDIMEQSIPDPNFDGIGIIDFESWRPVFRQNFGVLVPYKDISYQIERKLHWFWSEKAIQAKARQRFEEAGRQFMASTLALARRLRPRAHWGYYAFPYCFNMATNNMVENCAKGVPKENDEIQWLWSESSALYPSAYFSRGLSSSQQAAMLRGRVAEAARLARRKPVLPYFWFRYRDGGFLPQEQLDAALETLYKSNASGFIIWGSSNDVNTVDKCQKLLEYTEEILGPSIAKYTRNMMSNIRTTRKPAGTGITTWRPVLKVHEVDDKVSTESTNNPDYHWDPPENYTQDIIHYVESEIKRKNSSNTGDYDKPHYINIRKNSFLELLYNMLAYERDVQNLSTINNTINYNEDNNNNQNLVTSTPFNESIENNSNKDSLAVNNFTTNSPLENLLNNQNKDIPLSSSDINVVSTTESSRFTTVGYLEGTSNDGIINLIPTENINSMAYNTDQSTNRQHPDSSLETTEIPYSFSPNTDSGVNNIDTLNNLLQLDTFDNKYDSLDSNISEMDSFSTTTDPTDISLLDILTRPVTKMSTDFETQPKNFTANIYTEYEYTESNKIDPTTENIDIYTDDYIIDSTISETPTEPLEIISSSYLNASPSSNVSVTVNSNNEQNTTTAKNEDEDETYKITNTDKSTTAMDYSTIDKEESEELLFDEETTTSAVRQVGGSSNIDRRCHGSLIITILTITLSL